VSDQYPRRNPLACGALGRYDSALVAEIGRRLAGEVSAVHQDGESILLLDRRPIRWGARRTQGFAWSEGRPAERSVTSWKDAACELAACGLVAHGERRRVHSSVSGVAPIYYVEYAGAVYFASRIDPLVQALPRRYTIDWRAWASIFYLRFPIGERTPFREVKRLRPFSTLEWDPGRQEARARQHRWPWAEVEPSLRLDEGAGAIVEATRAAVAPLAQGSVLCTLSGGWDSRLLLCLLAEHGHDGLQAVTVDPDNGHRREEELAGEVARSLGVPHTTLEGDPAAFWDDTRERALRVDFQLAAPPWAMPLAAALRGRPGVATDGLALDTFAQGGTHYYTESMIRPDGTAAGARELWTRLLGQVMRHATWRTLSRELDDNLKDLARRQFMYEAGRFRGHPAETVLTFYATRTVRGISLTPHAVLGADVATVTPCTDHRVAIACLATDPLEKFHTRIYKAMFAKVNPTICGLPSTHDELPAPAVARDRRGLSAHAVRGYEMVLTGGPLERILSPEVREHLAQGTLGQALADPTIYRGVLAISLFHLWHERYRDRLANDDPLEELGLAMPGALTRRGAAATTATTSG
jgi:asparagine synthase